MEESAKIPLSTRAPIALELLISVVTKLCTCVSTSFSIMCVQNEKHEIPFETHSSDSLEKRHGRLLFQSLKKIGIAHRSVENPTQTPKEPVSPH